MLDITGTRYGTLVAIKFVEITQSGHSRFQCRCDCGVVKIFYASKLRCGITRNCGCLRSETRYKKHGHTVENISTVEYKAWLAMKTRCYNAKSSKYKIYGGRGISVCDRWLNSFELFLQDMGNRPPNHSLDRYPNKDGNYEPGNCRWATIIEQNRNKSDNVWYEYNGEKILRIDFLNKINADGKQVAIFIKKGMSISEIANRYLKK